MCTFGRSAFECLKEPHKATMRNAIDGFVMLLSVKLSVAIGSHGSLDDSMCESIGADTRHWRRYDAVAGGPRRSAVNSSMGHRRSSSNSDRGAKGKQAATTFPLGAGATGAADGTDHADGACWQRFRDPTGGSVSTRTRASRSRSTPRVVGGLG